MELKAQLLKPYTDGQRMKFIVSQNHRLGYEIRETETALEAWGEDATERLEDLRNQKYKENETIRDAFLVSGVKYKEVLWDSDLEQKLNISVQVSTMGDEDTVVWVAMDGVTALEMTKAELLELGALLTKMTAYVWQFKNPAIKAAIAEAQTEEELNEIEIDYNTDLQDNDEPTDETVVIQEGE